MQQRWHVTTIWLYVVQCFSLKHWNIEIVKKQVWISQSKLVYFFDISYLICRIQPSFGPNPRPKSNIKLTQNIEEVEKKKLLILFVNSFIVVNSPTLPPPPLPQHAANIWGLSYSFWLLRTSLVSFVQFQEA